MRPDLSGLVILLPWHACTREVPSAYGPNPARDNPHAFGGTRWTPNTCLDYPRRGTVRAEQHPRLEGRMRRIAVLAGLSWLIALTVILGAPSAHAGGGQAGPAASSAGSSWLEARVAMTGRTSWHVDVSSHAPRGVTASGKRVLVEMAGAACDSLEHDLIAFDAR